MPWVKQIKHAICSNAQSFWVGVGDDYLLRKWEKITKMQILASHLSIKNHHELKVIPMNLLLFESTVLLLDNVCISSVYQL